MITKKKILSLAAGVFLTASSLAQKNYTANDKPLEKSVSMECLVQTEYSLNKDVYGPTLEVKEMEQIEQTLLNWLNKHSCIDDGVVNYGRGINVIQNGALIDFDTRLDYSLPLKNLNPKNLPIDTPESIRLLAKTYGFCNDPSWSGVDTKKFKRNQLSKKGVGFGVGALYNTAVSNDPSNNNSSAGLGALVTIPFGGPLSAELIVDGNNNSSTQNHTSNVLEEEVRASGRTYKKVQYDFEKTQQNVLGSFSLGYMFNKGSSTPVTIFAGTNYVSQGLIIDSEIVDEVYDINMNFIGNGVSPDKHQYTTPQLKSTVSGFTVGLKIGISKSPVELIAGYRQLPKIGSKTLAQAFFGAAIKFDGYKNNHKSATHK